MIKYKTVIFDLNGVLLKSKHLSTRIQNKYGIPENEFYKAPNVKN